MQERRSIRHKPTYVFRQLSIKFITTFFIFCTLTTLKAQQKSTELEMYYEFYCLKKDGTPHINEEVIIYSVTRGKSMQKTTDSTGRIEAMLPYGHWKFYASRLGVKKKIAEFWIQEKTKGKYPDSKGSKRYEWKQKIKLDIRFESGKSEIKEVSYEALDEVFSYLEKYPEIRLEIIGHTDNVGDEDENQKLSLQRAEAIKAYLVDKGIISDRLQTSGKGETDPIDSNETEQGRKHNRRTELKTLD